jgi:hypothetical protein
MTATSLAIGALVALVILGGYAWLAPNDGGEQ